VKAGGTGNQEGVMQRVLRRSHERVHQSPLRGFRPILPAEVRIIGEPSPWHNTRHSGGKIKRMAPELMGVSSLAHISTHTHANQSGISVGSRTRADTQCGGALACRSGTGSGESVAYGLPAHAGVHSSGTETGSCRKTMARRSDKG
jgi:hypothetical protein